MRAAGEHISTATMASVLLLLGLETASAFNVPAPLRSLPACKSALSALRGQRPAQTVSKPTRGICAVRMAEDGAKDPEAMAKSVESFTELVRKVTGKEDYAFGDLSKGSMETISNTLDSVEKGGLEAMDQIVTTTSSPDYQFGDLTKAAAQEVVEWGRKERKAFESLTGKDYEFGDLSRFVASSVMVQARKRLGEDYQFGDLTRAAAASAADAVKSYKFGDISRGLMSMVQKAGEQVADGVKSAASDPEVSKNIETAAKARLELLEQEKIMITQVLQKGQADEADAGDVQGLLVQEMSYLESLCKPDEKK